MEYFVIGEDQVRFGPATVDELNVWSREGRVDRNTMVVPLEEEEPISILKVPGFQLAPPVKAVPPEVQRNYSGQPKYFYVENHLVKAIFVTLLCCLPFGLIAIVYATQVDGYSRGGDRSGAEYASEKAKAWGNWGFGIGATWIILYLLIALAGNGQR